LIILNSSFHFEYLQLIDKQNLKIFALNKYIKCLGINKHGEMQNVVNGQVDKVHEEEVVVIKEVRVEAEEVVAIKGDNTKTTPGTTTSLKLLTPRTTTALPEGKCLGKGLVLKIGIIQTHCIVKEDLRFTPD
jgi:hypothetical protein